MKRRNLAIASFGAACLIAAGTLFWILSAPHPAFPDRSRELSEPGDPERGRLVFAAGSCGSCHASPGQSNPLRLGGGMALASPYGTFRIPNISPNRKDGIGAWTSTDLANALLSGVSPAGEHYYPAFPYTSYARLRVSDVADLMAYLRTLPPVSGRAPPHRLTLLFRVRRVLGFWKLMFFHPEPLTPDPARNELWNRGRYLVEAAMHCTECHSSRNVFGAIRKRTEYAGAKDPEGVGYVPNITPTRIGTWSEDDLVRMLATGDTPGHGRVGSSMSDVVNNTAKLPERDRLAIAVYLKSLPPKPTEKP